MSWTGFFCCCYCCQSYIDRCYWGNSISSAFRHTYSYLYVFIPCRSKFISSKVNIKWNAFRNAKGKSKVLFLLMGFISFYMDNSVLDFIAKETCRQSNSCYYIEREQRKKAVKFHKMNLHLCSTSFFFSLAWYGNNYACIWMAECVSFWYVLNVLYAFQINAVPLFLR